MTKPRPKQSTRVVEALKAVWDLKAEADRRRQALKIDESVDGYTSALLKLDENPHLQGQPEALELRCAILSDRAEVLRLQASFDAAADDLKSLAVLFEKTGNLNGQVDALARRVRCLSLKGEAGALQEAESLLELAQDSGRLELECVASYALGDVLMRTGEYVRSLVLAERSLELALNQKDPGREAWARLVIANNYSRTGKLEEAKSELDASLALFRKIGDLDAQGFVLNSLGNLASAYDFAIARSHYEASKVAFETNGNIAFLAAEQPWKCLFRSWIVCPGRPLLPPGDREGPKKGRDRRPRAEPRQSGLRLERTGAA